MANISFYLADADEFDPAGEVTDVFSLVLGKDHPAVRAAALLGNMGVYIPEFEELPDKNGVLIMPVDPTDGEVRVKGVPTYTPDDYLPALKAEVGAAHVGDYVLAFEYDQNIVDWDVVWWGLFYNIGAGLYAACFADKPWVTVERIAELDQFVSEYVKERKEKLQKETNNE